MLDYSAYGEEALSNFENSYILMGKDSAANKAMDTAAMIGGATLCSPGGPLAMTACAGIAKSLSDGTQWLFGDKKSPEERRMEEALIALRGGQI